MPQVAKGKAARTAVVSVRFTEQERKELAALYGTAARGVYAIVRAALREKK